MGVIYTLNDPTTNAVRYVGQTKQMKRRKWQHCSRSNNRGNRKVNHWINRLLDTGLEPVFVVVEETDDLDAREMHWVAEYQSQGARLLNMNEGGPSLHSARTAPRSPNVTGKHTPLQHIRRQMTATAKFFRTNGHTEAYERAVKRIAEVDASIKRALKREGKQAALTRINAQLKQRVPYVA